MPFFFPTPSRSLLDRLVIAETAKVELNIYNLKGQLVKSLYSGVASSKTLAWNGKDDNGKNLSAGVYLYKIFINGKNRRNEETDPNEIERKISPQRNMLNFIG